MWGYALSFVFGTILGSFFNLVLFRKNTGESLVSGGSRCFSCGQKLTWLELIPIFSFIFLKGRCGHCGSKISLQYPTVELLVGLLALVVYFKILNSQFSIFNQFLISNFQFLNSLLVISYSLFVYYFAAFASLFLVATYDLRTKIIDRHFLYIFGFFSAIQFLLRGNFADDLASSFFMALPFYFLWLLSGGRWMGRGDADLAFFAALFLGFPLNLGMLFLSFWLGGLVGGLLLIFGRRVSLKSEIPFGPFLASAAFIAWYFAGEISVFYDIIW